MDPRLTLITLLLPVIASCGGGDGPAGPAPGEPYPLSSLLEICDGALRGRDVLDRAMAEYTAVLTWIDRPGATTVEIRIAYEGGAITCHPHFDAPPGTGMPSRAASVSVEVGVEFATGDGAFQEAFTAPLGGSLAAACSFSADLAPEEVGGAFDPGLPGYQDVRVAIEGHFDGPATWGTVLKGGQAPGRAPEVWFVATWGE